MDYSFYKITHFIGIFMMLTSMGGLIFFSGAGSKNDSWGKMAFATNGIGMLVALIGGFGVIAKLGLGFPGWILAKIAIWFVFALLVMAVRRTPYRSSLYWWGSIVLASVAAYLGHLKPF